MKSEEQLYLEEVSILGAKLNTEKLADILGKYMNCSGTASSRITTELLRWHHRNFESDAVNLLKKWGSPDFESDEQKEAA